MILTCNRIWRYKTVTKYAVIINVHILNHYMLVQDLIVLGLDVPRMETTLTHPYITTT